MSNKKYLLLYPIRKVKTLHKFHENACKIYRNVVKYI